MPRSAAVFLRSMPAWWVTALTAVALGGVSVWAARPFAGKHDDPGWVCIDETAGTVVALVGLSGWPWVVALVVASALADIFKCSGVAAAERLPGAVGITADDILAGLYGLAAGWGIVGSIRPTAPRSTFAAASPECSTGCQHRQDRIHRSGHRHDPRCRGHARIRNTPWDWARSGLRPSAAPGNVWRLTIWRSVWSWALRLRHLM